MRSKILMLGGEARAVGSMGATAMSSRRNGKPKVGKQLMKSHRKISLTTALLAALMVVVPATASANSLLSGYGGPGAGNQAILGSALIGGGGSAGGGGSSGSGGSAGSVGSSSGAAAGSEGLGNGETVAAGSSGGGSEAGAKGGAAGEGAEGRAAGGTAGSGRAHGEASSNAARAYPVRPLDDASKPISAGSGALGFSAADLGYLLLVLAVLGATGFVTRRLARAPNPAGRTATTGKGL
jgi:hypothetical protein